MSATIIPSVGLSMAEHLQNLRGGARPDFQEPLPSVEQLQQLFDQHQADVPIEDYLREICAAWPSGTAVATFPVVLDSGNFFQGVSMPRIMDSLIRDNGNSVLQGLLGDHIFGAIDKRREGGLRLLVRTEAAQQALIGEEVSVLGRKFRLGLESPLSKCFFLDVTGLSTSVEAIKLLRTLASSGANPVYFRPAAYDKGSGLCSTTWRYYFPGDDAPPSLLRDGVLRSYVRVGRRSYRCFGKNEASGGRQRTVKTSTLPSGQPTAILQRAGPVCGRSTAAATQPTSAQITGQHSSAEASSDPPSERSSPPCPPPSQEDKAMLIQVAGAKRAHTVMGHCLQQSPKHGTHACAVEEAFPTWREEGDLST